MTFGMQKTHKIKCSSIILSAFDTQSVNEVSGNVDLDYAVSDFSTTTTKNNSSTNTLEQILEHVASIDEKLG